jgi:hypothetical protein
LPPDLKSVTKVSKHENLIEGLRTIAAVILMAVIFLVVIFAGVSSDPVDYPVDREVMRR